MACFLWQDACLLRHFLRNYSGNTVNINFDLGLSENVTLLVTATNAEGSEDIYEVTFTTDSKYKYYDDSDMEGIDYILADGSWILSYDPAATDTTALAATEMATSAANYNVGNKKNAAVYRVPLPEVPEGKEERFEWLKGMEITDDTTDEEIMKAKRGYSVRFAKTAVRFRKELIKRYGEERGNKVRYAEAYEICEYGGELTEELKKELFYF